MDLLDAGHRAAADMDGSAASALPLAGAAYQPYVSELLSFSIERLHKEPELLRGGRGSGVRRQMQEVAVENYGRLHLRVRGALLRTRAARGVRQPPRGPDRGNTKLNIWLHWCIRNGNYDEALDLEAFVSKISKLHPDLPVVQGLAAEVKKTVQSLISQLLQKLRSNIQLPECLRIVAHLRRIGVFGESELRLQFLRCREAWLSGILEDLDQRNVYDYLKGMVTCHRVHLFDCGSKFILKEYELQRLKTSSSLDSVVLDSHRWVPMPSVGFVANGVVDETSDDVTPPSVLMEHPPLAVFVNGVSAAMNELRPCAPLSLKDVLAQEVVKGLQAVSDSLVRYNAMRMLRGNESALFLSLCQAFIECVEFSMIKQWFESGN
ncbi:hypothetical protein HU200_010821 [Digitaria exilis]|uniref:Conserved oligomeric Golgi complex subunit 8 n=1 Tax=Digitaria exilis TaxID=1010633 RepID=A0A835FHP2_9POAL|nr:hypothetical protein HU200_010821 [Digitaria exilis]